MHCGQKRTCLFIIFSLLISLLAVRAYALTATMGAQRYILKNGMTVLLKEDHSSPVASIQVWVKTGSANETEEEAGITHMIEHMIFKGTHNMKAGEIARIIEGYGGDINAYTTFDRTVYKTEIPSEHFEKALNILIDALLDSLFDPTELSREKEVVLEEYRRSLDIPERRLRKAMMELIYKNHPYGRPVIGYESTIRTFDRQAILKYIEKWYTAENIVLAAVGDFDTEETLEQIKLQVEYFPSHSTQKQHRPSEPAQESTRALILKQGVEQCYMEMSWRIPSITHPNIPALDVLEIILGNGKSSRLYSQLKMHENIVHNLFAYSNSLKDSGLFSIWATLSPANIDQTLDIISHEIGTLMKEPVTIEELQRAKRIVEANFLFDLEEMDGQAGTLAFFEAMTGDMGNADEYLNRLKKVTAMDLIQVAGQYFRPDNLSVGLLLPDGFDPELSESDILKRVSDTFSGPSSAHTESVTSGKSIEKIELSNGIRLIIKEDNRLPLVSLRVVMLGGVRLETPELSGISEFVSRMLTRGTDSMTASEIAEFVESRAGELTDFSGRNSFGLSVRFLSKDLPSFLYLISHLILRSNFPEMEIEKVRQDLLADIQAKKDSPARQLSDLFYQTLYKNHPYGRPGSGSEETIRSIRRSDLLDFYSSLIMPSNIVISLVGDLSRDIVLEHLEESFDKIDIKKHRFPAIPPEPPLEDIRKVHIERTGEQVHLIIGFLGASLMDEDHPVMDLIDTALSGQGGRLFKELRDKQSLAYSVSSFRRPGLETGAFGVYLACDPKKLPTAINSIMQELVKIREDGLTPNELIEAKNYMLGSHAIEFQTNGSQAMQMALNELYGLGFDHDSEYLLALESVSLDDIKKATAKYITLNKYVIATVGPS